MLSRQQCLRSSEESQSAEVGAAVPRLWTPCRVGQSRLGEGEDKMSDNGELYFKDPYS